MYIYIYIVTTKKWKVGNLEMIHVRMSIPSWTYFAVFLRGIVSRETLAPCQRYPINIQYWPINPVYIYIYTLTYFHVWKVWMPPNKPNLGMFHKHSNSGLVGFRCGCQFSMRQKVAVWLLAQQKLGYHKAPDWSYDRSGSWSYPVSAQPLLSWCNRNGLVADVILLMTRGVASTAYIWARRLTVANPWENDGSKVGWPWFGSSCVTAHCYDL